MAKHRGTDSQVATQEAIQRARDAAHAELQEKLRQAAQAKLLEDNRKLQGGIDW